MLRQRLLSLACALRGACGTPSAGPLAALQQAAAVPSAAPAGLQALQLVSCRYFSAWGTPAAQAAAEREFIALNSLADNPGATHYVRAGRGARRSKGWTAAVPRRRQAAGGGGAASAAWPILPLMAVDACCCPS